VKLCAGRLPVAEIGVGDRDVGPLAGIARLGEKDDLLGARIGQGAREVALATVKIAVSAPIPSAKVTIARVVKAGCLASARIA